MTHGFRKWAKKGKKTHGTRLMTDKRKPIFVASTNGQKKGQQEPNEYLESRRNMGAVEAQDHLMFTIDLTLRQKLPMGTCHFFRYPPMSLTGDLFRQDCELASNMFPPYLKRHLLVTVHLLFPFY
ncbi:hypothetical protein PoB_006419400 [Plakobranchus ocellatus]|uniref:Uncharacterized protein n=1 Tax=Plakobranchus ocellatus TaxID=259542 RepID=A0AAV4D0G1_9GAST|nr:hypothetical protein PoB_006419400 [Plakobranchus ocellatus]